MTIADRKIAAFTKKVTDLADKPNATLTATELKAWWDSSPEELRGGLNGLIDDLLGTNGASFIGVAAIAGLTGANVQAIMESLKNKIDSVNPLAGFVNVKDPSFGAKGDGMADDSIAIQNALDSMVTGGTIYFPDGNYIKSSAITINYSNIKVVCAPNAKITETVKGCSGFLVADGVHDITFDGVNLYGVSDSIEPAAYGISCRDNSHDITFQNCRFDGYTGGLIYNYLNYNMRCEGCSFYNMYYVPTLLAGGYGIVFQASHDTQTINNYFDGSVNRHHLYVGRNPSNLDPKGYGHVISGNIFVGTNKANYATGFEYLLKVMGNSDVSITNNVFVGGVGHIWLTSAGTIEPNPKNITVAGNTFSGISKGDSTHSYAIGSDGTTIIENLVIIGNTIKDCDCSGGVKLVSGLAVIVSNNAIENITNGHGITSELGLVDSVISGNIIKNLGTGRGIFLDSSYSAGNECANVTIRGNEIKTANFGIFLNGISSGIIESNHISGTTFQCLMFGNVKFVGEIRHNVFEGGNNAIMLNAASADPIFVYGNVYKGQSDVSVVNSGNAYLLTPTKNGRTGIAGGNVRFSGAAAPVSGTWLNGDIMDIALPIPGGYVGYACTAGGTPGTWKGFGLIQA